MKYILLIIAFISMTQTYAQEEYSLTKIPEELKKNADAIIRYECTNFIQKDINNGTEEVTKVITILNEKGKDKAHLLLSQDKFRELKSFSGEIILATGEVFKKIGKGELGSSAISNHLATDDYWIFYNCTAPSYPFTVKYKYEVKWKGGIACYPSFAPLTFSTAIELAEFRIEFPNNQFIRYKGNEKVPNPLKSSINKDSVYLWKIENIQAIQWESMSLPVEKLFPIVYASPGDFCFDGICGKMSNWQELGIFLSQLLDKKDVLPQTTIDKIKEITLDANGEKEKIQKIYEYLQSTTRYVSIQLGIGGFQPIPAAQVVKTGYGDCKALTNYMKAMLNIINIPSVYAMVDTEKKELFPDFSSLTQGDHVILMVPLKGDSIWLECTSRELPFGYIHNTIAGHEVLLVDGEKSHLCRIKDIPETLNTENNHVHMKIAQDASIHADIRSKYKNHNTEEHLNFVLNMSKEDQINNLSQNLSIQKPQISQIKSEYIKSEYPEICINYTIDAERYANLTGSRMFVKLNPFKSGFSKTFSSSTRLLDIEITNSIYQTDTMQIEIPENFVMESKPGPTLLEMPLGTFSLDVKEENNLFTVIQKINIPSGKYPATSYSDLKEFFKKIDMNMSVQLVLRKEN